MPGGLGGVWRWNTDPARPDFWRTAPAWPSGGHMTHLRAVPGSVA